MQTQRKNRPFSNDRRQLIRQRTELEARLLAYRCGWLSADEINIRKLKRALARVLGSLEGADPLAEELLRG